MVQFAPLDPEHAEFYRRFPRKNVDTLIRWHHFQGVSDFTGQLLEERLGLANALRLPTPEQRDLLPTTARSNHYLWLHAEASPAV